MNIAVLQSQIPHYREDFFRRLVEQSKCDLFIYQEPAKGKGAGFHLGNITAKKIWSVEWKGFVIYDWISLFKKYDLLILPLHIGHLSTWLMLLLKFVIRKKVIVWGHGISVKRYLKEEVHPDWKIKLMIRLSDGVWTYMPKEAMQWQKCFPHKPITALYNTISGAKEKVAYREKIKKSDRDAIKNKHGIKQPIIFIFCARFEGEIRRTDLLEAVINKLPTTEYGFIIIGGGRNKPDFSIYSNVYDFGAVYDENLKNELFSVADIYFQPGWVGLSIVEAMAYGLPIFTFKRSPDIYQCVEYSYIRPGFNGFTFSDINDCVEKIRNTSIHLIRQMGLHAMNEVKQNMTIEKMAERAISTLKNLQ